MRSKRSGTPIMIVTRSRSTSSRMSRDLSERPKNTSAAMESGTSRFAVAAKV